MTNTLLYEHVLHVICILTEATGWCMVLISIFGILTRLKLVSAYIFILFFWLSACEIEGLFVASLLPEFQVQLLTELPNAKQYHSDRRNGQVDSKT